jgi:hypothetical protein
MFFLITQYNADVHNTHAHSPYEYTYANPTPMNTSEGLSTGRFSKSPLAHRRDGNVAHHLTHNAGNPGINPGNPTPMSTSERLSTDRSGDSRSHHWRLVIDGNVAYHLTHNAGNPGINPVKGAGTKIWTLVGVGSVPLDRPTIGQHAHSQLVWML